MSCHDMANSLSCVLAYGIVWRIAIVVNAAHLLCILCPHLLDTGMPLAFMQFDDHEVIIV